MIRARTFRVVLAVIAFCSMMGVGVAEGDVPADAPWELETIASIAGGEVGQYTSIAFSEAAGKPYISYYDATNGDLRLIYPHETSGNCGPNNAWYCEAPDTQDDVGQFSSIDTYHDDLTGENKIGIAYFDATNRTLKVAIWSSSGFPVQSWSVATVDGGFGIPQPDVAGRSASLKFASDGSVHIAYATYGSIIGYEYDYVYHAQSVAAGGNCGHDTAAGKWQCDIVSDGAGWFDPGAGISLDLTPSDEPVIAHMNTDWEMLELCEKTNDAWSCRTIDAEAGGNVALAIDPSGSPHIGYYGRDNGTLKYASYVGSGGNCGNNGGTFEYQCDVIDTIGSDQSRVGLSIALDLDNYPLIAYKDDSDPLGYPALNVARPALAHGMTAGNCGPIVALVHQWQCDTIDDASQGGGFGYLYEADFVSVAFDSFGLATVAYDESDDYYNEIRLKIADQQSPDPIFSDGFESGSCSGWSSAVGEQ
jgi:hypothetical protein